MNSLINYLWFFLILFSVICAAATGRMPQLSAAVISGAGEAVTLSIGMAGMMCAWTGLLKIAEKGGASRYLAKALRPVVGRLFPSCRDNSRAGEAICMNIAANLLGLGNAATPLGIAAMKELKKNNRTDTADNDMAMFVVVNAASIQLIPTFLAALRSKYGAVSPFDILPAVWLTSAGALAAGIAAAKLFERKKHA